MEHSQHFLFQNAFLKFKKNVILHKNFKLFRIEKTLFKKEKILRSWRLKYHSKIRYLDNKIKSKLYYFEKILTKVFINWKKQIQKNLHHKTLKKQSVLFYLRKIMKKILNAFLLNYKKHQADRYNFECILLNDNVRILKQSLNLWRITSEKFALSKTFRKKIFQRKVLNIFLKNLNEFKNKETIAKAFYQKKIFEKSENVFKKLVYFFNYSLKQRINNSNAEQHFYMIQTKKYFLFLKEVYLERLAFYKKIHIFRRLSFKKKILCSWRKYLMKKKFLSRLFLKYDQEKIVRLKEFMINKWMSNFNEAISDKEKKTRSHVFYVSNLKRKLLYEFKIYKTGNKHEKIKIHQITNIRASRFLKLWLIQSEYEKRIKEFLFIKYLRKTSKILMNLKNFSTKRKKKILINHQAKNFLQNKFFRLMKSYWIFKFNKKNHHVHLLDLISFRKKEKCFKSLHCYFLIKFEKRRIIEGILEKKRQKMFRTFFDIFINSNNAIKYELVRQYGFKVNIKLMRRTMGILYKNKVKRRRKKEYCQKIAGYFNLKKLSGMFHLLKNYLLNCDHKQLHLIIGKLILNNKRKFLNTYYICEINFIFKIVLLNL